MHFLEGLKVNQRQEGNMAIYFTQPIHHGGYRLHSALPPPQLLPPRPMGLNLGTYNIWDRCVFGLPHAMFAVERGNYNLIPLL